MSQELFDDLFDADSTALQSETQPFDAIILNAIDSTLKDVHTWLPAQITKINGNQSVNLQPLLQRKYKDGTLDTLPEIQNVPVWLPRGNNYWIKLPIAVGDTGIALFCERSLDTWKVSGGIVDPQDSRTHDLTDAIFIPGINGMNAQVPGNSTDMILHNQSAEIYLQPGGTFKVTNGSQELISNIIQLVQALQQALTLTLLGPQPFMQITQLQLQQILQQLQTLQGK